MTLRGGQAASDLPRTVDIWGCDIEMCFYKNKKQAVKRDDRHGVGFESKM